LKLQLKETCSDRNNKALSLLGFGVGKKAGWRGRKAGWRGVAEWREGGRSLLAEQNGLN